MPTNEKEKHSRGGIQVIARAADILRTLKTSQSGMSLGQIAQRVNLPRSTVQRIVNALQQENFIITDSQGGGLRLGPELNALAEATRYNIVEYCRLLLTELTQSTGETSDLSVFRRDAMICLDQVPGTHRLRTVSAVGEAFPLSSTANGRACLSLMEEYKAQQLVLSEWTQWGVKGDMEAMMADLSKIRSEGLAFDEDHHTPGISAIGFAFRDWFGDLHAISVPVPSSRYPGKKAEIEVALHKTAAHIKKRMTRSA
jgi:DNA-binding IclR family transcriptional regulator